MLNVRLSLQANKGKVNFASCCVNVKRSLNFRERMSVRMFEFKKHEVNKYLNIT